MDFERNNLDRSGSPYLRQHADNPVWWQEWNEHILSYAAQTGKPLLVSVGYSTCHWCHVMAAGAFSDPACAAYLNEAFVSVKVDREQRPDIDHYLMTFLVATTGSGGWPLNAFLSPQGHPFFAMTYAGSEPRFNMPGFREILERVAAFHTEHAEEIEPFDLPTDESRVSALLSGGVAADEPFVVPITDDDEAAVQSVVEKLSEQFDSTHAGFGRGAKFPPHAPLLFLQHAGAAGFAESTDSLVLPTLDIMQRRGLHDHVQGGFFRYTVDQTWTVPHFEKMLYDQALLLWNYALASRRYDREDYRRTASGIIRCLEQTFVVDGFYASGHDADTDHAEGATYLWTLPQLREILTAEELERLAQSYELSEKGNFEGAIHLAGSDGGETGTPALTEIHETLLAARLKRAQPHRDEKIVVSWNALAAIALFAADRFAGIPAGQRASELTELLVERFVDRTRVFHGSFESQTDTNQFLADHAAMLLLLTFAREHSDDLAARYETVEAQLAEGITAFSRDGIWVENLTADFDPIPADPYDQPIPSSVSMAEYALLRRAMQTHTEYSPLPLAHAQGRAFSNIASLASMGYFWVVESPEHYRWADLPPNCVFTSGEHRVSCYRGVCYLGPPPVTGERK